MTRILSVLFLVLFAVSTFAQEADEKYPKTQVFGGFSKQFVLEDRIFTGPSANVQRDSISLNGFNFSGDYAVYRHGDFSLGLVGDLSGAFGRSANALTVDPGPPVRLSQDNSTRLHNFLTGVRASYEIKEKLRIFGDALLGVSRVSGQDFEPSTKFASAFGGGIDVYLGKTFFISPLRAHLIRNNFGQGTVITPPGSNDNQYSVRTSTGIGFRF